MLAGFSTADITPALGLETPGGYGKAFITAIHDPLKVRVAVFEQDAETLAFVSLDTCQLPPSMRFVDRVRSEVEQSCGIRPDHLIIAVSHTHSGGPLANRRPDEFMDAPAIVQTLLLEHTTLADPAYDDWVSAQIVSAVREAHAKREPALLSVGSGIEDQILFNRRFKMANGRVYTHPGKGNPEIVEPAGPVDPEVGVVGAWSSRGELLGCLVNYGCHCTVFGDAGISADYVCYLEETIERMMGPQAVVVFLQGGSGDVTQVNNQSPCKPEFGEAWSMRIGTRIGAEVIKVLATAEQGRIGPLAAASTLLRIPRRAPSPERLSASRRIVEDGLRSGDRGTAWTFAKEILILDYLIQKEPEVVVEVQALQLGPVIFLANPSEFFAESTLALKCALSFPLTYIVTLANRCVGYVPPESAFAPDGGGYETVLSSYSNLDLSAERQISDASIALAERFTPGSLPRRAQIELPGAPWDYGILGPDLE